MTDIRDHGIGIAPSEVLIEFVNYYNSTSIQKTSKFVDAELSGQRFYHGGAKVGNYAVFAGGVVKSHSERSYNHFFSTVDAFNESFVRTVASDLTGKRFDMASAYNSNFAVFAGGDSNLGSTSNVDAYNSSLTKYSIASLPDPCSKSRNAGGKVGDYAVIGLSYGFITGKKLVAYNTSLSQTVLNNVFSRRREKIATANAGNYVLFAGGYDYSYSDYVSDVEAFDSSLTKVTPTSLSEARCEVDGASVGDNAIFLGGKSSSGCSNRVDIYNASLTRIATSNISNGVVYTAGVGSQHYALFAGGYCNGYTNKVVCYDSSLVQTTLYLYKYIFLASGVSLNDTFIFSGGATSLDYSTTSNTVEGFRIVYQANLPITKNSKYKFTEETEQVASNSTTLTYNQKVTGYIKLKQGTV